MPSWPLAPEHWPYPKRPPVMYPPPYCTVEQVRAVGMPTPPTDADVQAAIDLGAAYTERACRQWFYPKPCVFYMDGTDSDALNFSVPIITVQSLRLNSSSEILDPMFYRAYNQPEDRDNPRIKLMDNRFGDMDIFVAPLNIGRMMFRKGRQNQIVQGIFGYTEPDGSVPLPIQRAVLLLALEKLSNPVYVNPAAPPPPLPPVLGNIQEEGTDGHYIKYVLAGGNTKTVRVSAFAGWTNNPEVLQTWKAYRSPISMAVPANASYVR